MSLVGELWTFLRARKKLWLLPIPTVTCLLGTLLMLAKGAASTPFIYTLF